MILHKVSGGISQAPTVVDENICKNPKLCLELGLVRGVSKGPLTPASLQLQQNCRESFCGGDFAVPFHALFLGVPQKLPLVLALFFLLL